MNRGAHDSQSVNQMYYDSQAAQPNVVTHVLGHTFVSPGQRWILAHHSFSDTIISAACLLPSSRETGPKRGLIRKKVMDDECYRPDVQVRSAPVYR